MIAPKLVLYLMAAAAPIGLILSLLVHRALRVRGPNRPHGFLTITGGTALTIATTGLIAVAASQIFGAITYPKFDATVIDVTAKTVEVEDDDGDLEMRTYYRATYRFIGPNGEEIIKRSDQSGTSSMHEGDIVRIAYKDGTMIELNTWGYIFLAVFVLVAVISFWLWHMMMSLIWRRKDTPRHANGPAT